MKPRLRADLAEERMVSGVSVNVVSGILLSCCGEPINRNSVLEGFKANMLSDIQFEMDWNTARREAEAFWNSLGLMEMNSCVSSAYR